MINIYPVLNQSLFYMKKVVLFFVLLTSTLCYHHHHPSSFFRIKHGEIVTKDSLVNFPFHLQIGIHLGSGKLYTICGATLIAPTCQQTVKMLEGNSYLLPIPFRIALSAGHCVQNETTCNMREYDIRRPFYVFSGMYMADNDEVTRKESKVE